MNRELIFRALWNGQWAYFDLRGGFTDVGYQIYQRLLTEKATFYQMTDFKDKNGTPIFQGDVMTEFIDGKPRELWKDKSLYVWVVWNEIKGCWELADNNQSSDYSFTNKNWEIVGDIVNHPYLLL